METNQRIGEEIDSDLDESVWLQSSWCLWFDRYIGRGFTASEYAEAIKQVFVVNGVQDFWKWYNNLPTASDLDPSCTYHLMKHGIRPLWEDPGNVRGGNMTAKISCKDANQVWLKLCLVAISGQFDEFLANFGDEICGVSIGMRKTDASIYIWNAEAKTFNQQRMVGYLEEILSSNVDESLGETNFKSNLSESAIYKVHQSLENFGNEQAVEGKGKEKENKTQTQTQTNEGFVGTKKKNTQKRPNYEPVRAPIYDKHHHKSPRKMDMKILRPAEKKSHVDIVIQ